MIKDQFKIVIIFKIITVSYTIKIISNKKNKYLINFIFINIVRIKINKNKNNVRLQIIKIKIISNKIYLIYI